MKRIYECPKMEMEEFVVNTTVATCTRLPAGNAYDYTAQEIDCVVTTTDIIFVDQKNGCKHVIDPSGSTDYMFTTYNGQLYFCWKNNIQGNQPPNDSDVRLLQAIMDTAGVNDAQGWHAGPANEFITELYSHS